MQKICLDAVNTVDLDFRQARKPFEALSKTLSKTLSKDLVKSVVVAGGTSMLLNLAPRLRREAFKKAISTSFFSILSH